MAIVDMINIMHMQHSPAPPGLIQFKIVDQYEPLSADISPEEVEEIWKDARENNPRMFNAPRVFLSAITPTSLELTLGEYKTFFATMRKMQNVKDRLAIDQIENYLRYGLSVLGLAIAYESNEGSLILQNRSQQLTQGGGLHMLPAGGVMPQRGAKIGDLVNPFEDAYKQLKDEQNFGDRRLKYIGTVSTLNPEGIGNPTLIFTGRSEQPMTELDRIFQRAKDRYETNYLHFISSEAETLLRTLAGEAIDVMDGKRIEGEWYSTGLGGIVVYGAVRYGDEWLQEARRVLPRIRFIDTTERYAIR